MRDSLGVTGELMRIPALLVLLLAVQARASAQAAPQSIVVKGLETLASGHCRDAINGWTTAWTGQDAFKRTELINGCDYLDQIGTIHGYDILNVTDVTPHLQRVYVLLRYENQPVYLLVVAYEPKDEWKIVTVTWNTDPDKVLPPELVPAQHRGP